jgi:hypothetical protein
MRFLAYLWRMIRELFAYAWHRKVWWMAPVVLALLLLAFLIVSGTAVAPFIYTLF